MIFVMHVSTAFILSVFLGSIWLVIWSMRNKGEGTYLGRIIGVVTAIACLFSLTCIGYYGFQYWLKGEYETGYMVPAQMQHMSAMEMHKINNQNQNN